MNFGEAIEAIKRGEAVSRSGWNGKNMLIYLNKGNIPWEAPESRLVDDVRSDLFERGATGTVVRLPNINMRSATGSTVTGWLASQTDMLAEDWGIVTPQE